MTTLEQAFAYGYACLSARSELLDRINVYPVADNDTGANLRVTLAPLRSCGQDRTRVARQIVYAAAGNSGNIAAAFFSALLKAGSCAELAVYTRQGSELARKAVASPQAGTMLDVFAATAILLDQTAITQDTCPVLLDSLRQTVQQTSSLLPDLCSAAVVDAGALGMYLFFEGFFDSLAQRRQASPALKELFPFGLEVAASFAPAWSAEHCITATLKAPGRQLPAMAELQRLGDCVVAIPGEDQLKLHLHAANPSHLRSQLDSYGQVISWTEEPVQAAGNEGAGSQNPPGCVHIMTDAAGSLSPALARQHGITLLDSYILLEDMARPETLCDPELVYRLLRAGERVTTAQSSQTERYLRYRATCEQFGRTLYLCVGSAYTGNYQAAFSWKRDHDPGDQLVLVDSGAASGKLAIIALLASRFARTMESIDQVVSAVNHLGGICREYVFIDRLQYLAAGGRVTKAAGFFGDLFHLKPVISPGQGGVRKEGAVHSHQAQVDFALKKLETELPRDACALVLLQYSDNQARVEGEIEPRVRQLLPQAEILCVPLSLTSGVHMGPGTWSLAFAPVS